MAYTQYEGPHTGAYLVSDDIALSREEVILDKGNIYSPGEVLGQKKADGHFAPLNPTAQDGTEIAKAISYDSYDAMEAPINGFVSLRQTAVKASELIWPEGITTKQQEKAVTELSQSTIILR